MLPEKKNISLSFLQLYSFTILLNFLYNIVFMTLLLCQNWMFKKMQRFHFLIQYDPEKGKIFQGLLSQALLEVRTRVANFVNINLGYQLCA